MLVYPSVGPEDMDSEKIARTITLTSFLALPHGFVMKRLDTTAAT